MCRAGGSRGSAAAHPRPREVVQVASDVQVVLKDACQPASLTLNINTPKQSSEDSPLINKVIMLNNDQTLAWGISTQRAHGEVGLLAGEASGGAFTAH